MKKPSPSDMRSLMRFLMECERAAVPPPPPLTLQTMSGGLLGGLIAPQRSAMQIGLGETAYPRTLQDVLGKEAPPFESAELLADSRTERVATLKTWLERFAAFKWLSEQAAIRSSFEVFKSIQTRRRTDPRFSDDLAEFRFWLLALDAVAILDAKNKPPPLAEQRQSAKTLAHRLSALINTTTLLGDAGIGYREQEVLTEGLKKIEGLAALKRRKRVDAFTSDRSYVRLLALISIGAFNDAPPTLICELSALKIKSPDITQVTKQISAFKRSRATAA